MLNPRDELVFWNGIMSNHGEFMLTALSSREPQFIAGAQFFKNLFASLENESMNDSISPTLINMCMQAVLNFISFKRFMLKKSLECKIELNLPPTFVNHMINEALNYYKTLVDIQQNILKNKTLETINLHNLWLPDAAGHAATISDDLDPIESELIKKSDKFKKDFENLSMKARELGIMLKRACLSDHALDELNNEVEKKMCEFIEFLEKIKNARAKCGILGILKPLVPDHMIREEMHYLEELRSLK
jgi:hypothetical protein